MNCFRFLILGLNTEHLNVFYVRNCMKHTQKLWVDGCDE
jgi:hypothetical protein